MVESSSESPFLYHAVKKKSHTLKAMFFNSNTEIIKQGGKCAYTSKVFG
jgi:hypothetical protein